jgi:carbon-monoxide dehydrogenase small subunit
VVTVNGLEPVDPELTARHRPAVRQHHAIHCGYSTPGMLVLAFWWLRSSPEERAACGDAAALLESNLCRCTGYFGLRAAVEAVANQRREQ